MTQVNLRLRHEESMSKSSSENSSKQLQIENLEQRIALTAQAVTDIDPQMVVQDSGNNIEITTMLHDAHQSSGVNYVHENFGFDGSGQTIAVIDSGIAWDHYALGGGFGAGHHVVGGWDFAENDANPYDDGPAGFHGTHVSGIIGSLDSEHPGVASGADLVSLRVFNDNGQSNFTWIEQALNWVHEHRNDFANPITTVNLSLGVAWNSDSIPGWATLEDEFAQLEADGIFVSVAAGNAFQNYQTPGLSYPAASPHVVPVASHDAEGQMSDFSQRNQRVLVAPGEDIYSTVPDHLFMGSQTGQFMRGSGTSMAAPYVGGASALIREANAFMGNDHLNQDQIYEHFRQTANQIYDSATNAWYDRIDMRAAIDAIVTDAHADQWTDATDLGVLEEQLQTEGTIGKFTDVDAFRFTASEDGRVTLSFEQSHELQSLLTLRDGSFDIVGETIQFDVEAGQVYEFSMATQDGIGHYQIDIALESTGDGNQGGYDAQDLGVVTDSRFQVANVQAEAWYQIQSSQNGILTAQLLAQSNFQLEVFDGQGNQLGAVDSTNGLARFDTMVDSDQILLVRVVGDLEHGELRFTNLLDNANGSIQVDGTIANDQFQIRDQADQVLLKINGVEYHFDRDQVEQIAIHDSQGQDRIHVITGDADNLAEIGPGSIQLGNQQFQLIASGEFISLQKGGQGNDVVKLLGSSGADRIYSTGYWTQIQGQGFRNQVVGFSELLVESGAGIDIARLRGSEGDDSFGLGQSQATMSTEQGTVELRQVDRVLVEGRGGNDQISITGSEGSDEFIRSVKGMEFLNDGFSAEIQDIETIVVDGAGGSDRLLIGDTVGDDVVTVNNQGLNLASSSLSLDATGFEVIRANSHSGQDQLRVQLNGTSHMVEIGWAQTRFQSEGMTFEASGFQQVVVDATQSVDDAISFVGNQFDDRLYWMGDQTTLISNGRNFRGLGFESVTADLGGGNDVAIIVGTDEQESLEIRRHQTRWQGESYQGTLMDVDRFYVTGRGSNDAVAMFGYGQSDFVSGQNNLIQSILDEQQFYLRDFASLQAHADPDETSNADFGAVDYLFELHGDWN